MSNIIEEFEKIKENNNNKDSNKQEIVCQKIEKYIKKYLLKEKIDLFISLNVKLKIAILQKKYEELLSVLNKNKK